MMASHRSSEPEPLEQPLPTEPTPPASGDTGLPTLPASGVVVGIDWFLCLAILVLAFLVASFSVRNSDFFMHLATGRLLSEGGYSFGKDPFSFVGEDRTWVNHSWLFDWLLFRLYSAAGGPGVVIAKAVAVAVSAGVLLLARRPGQSVFPGVVCVGLALVACTPRLLLQPTVASILGVAVLMGLLVRVAKPAGSWRFPVCIAVLFAFWSNLDQWFFLGPVFLLLYTVGQMLRPAKGENSGTLWKALLLGILACMVNPHHIRVWTLPPELVSSSLKEILGDDAELGSMFRSALTKGSLDFAGERDNWANLYCLLVLLALSLIGFVTNFKRISVGLALVWAGAVVVAILHLRAIPYLACVAAPVAAINLADALRRLVEVSRSEQSVRAFLAIRSVGRGLAVLTVLFLVAVSYPGWLNISTHPPRRWAWDVEPNTSMQRTAERLKKWKNDGLLPAEARLLNLQPDFAHYVAWYAPEIKSYFDIRLRFHREEAADYAALRRHLAPGNAKGTKEDGFKISEFLKANGITYAVTSHASRRWNESVLVVLLGEDRNRRGPEWAIWHIEGRAVVLGWTRQETIAKDSFDRLRFDPLRSAYVEAIPMGEAKVEIPLPLHTVWERYLAAPAVSPTEGEEALLLMVYGDTVIRKSAATQREFFVAMHFFGQQCQMPALNLWTLLPIQPNLFQLRRSPIPTMLPPEANAVALLSVRAARRAIANSPDHPDGYFYLAMAYSTFAGYEFLRDLEQIVTLASLARCRVRLSEDPTQKRATPYDRDLLERLGKSHVEAVPQRLDLLLDVIRSGVKSFRAETEEVESTLGRFEGVELARKQEEIDSRNTELKRLDREIESLEGTVRKNTENYLNEAAALSTPVERAAVARRYGLVREATNELHKAHEKYQKQSESERMGKELSLSESAQRLAVYAELVELMIFDGRVEEAVNVLSTMDHDEALIAMESVPLKDAYRAVRRKVVALQSPRSRSETFLDSNPAMRYRGLRLAVSMITGNFERATKLQAHQLQLARKELDAYRTAHFPKGPPDSTNVPSQLELTLELWYQPTLTVLTYYRREYYRKVEQLLGLSSVFAEQQVRLAMTFLEQGDVPKAAYHFQQSLETPEWKTPLPAQRTAREYLKAIEKAGLPQGGTP